MSEQELKREQFKRIDLDSYHYYYSFGVPGFEICLEPCAAGFDVAVYYAEEPEFRSTVEPKQCTKTGDYLIPLEALFGDRKDEDWNKALVIADELLEKYIKDREKFRELLAQPCLYRLCREAVLEKAKENKNFWLELWQEQLYMKQLLRGDYILKIRKPVIE